MEFKEVIIPGHFLDDLTFSFTDFIPLEIDIPKEFIDAMWGYGRHYGLFYGRGL